MKVLIFKGAPINRLLDGELQSLQEAGIEFAITNNNDKFGIDNKNDKWTFNTNTLVFMWPEYYVEEKENWIDRIKDSANIVSNIIKHIFEDYCNNVLWESEWKHLSNHLNHMNLNQTIVYNLDSFSFGAE